ncbi:MAG TPA: phenylalanine--tRNA ligase subunit beta [Bacteroidota bacterium]
MKISHSWLRKYVDFKLTPQQMVDGLTMLGLEVESFEDLAKKYDRFVVGEVVERAKHPNADRLTLCKVNTGKEIQEIVCGAPNVAAGQKVAVALVGATIPHDQHDPEGNPFVLGRATIRGIQSNGMICSAFELGLGEDASGITVLDPDAKPGTPLSAYLGQTDIIYEIGITPNRADCLSHIGVAREVGLLSGRKVRMPGVKLKESKVASSKHATIVLEDKHGCPRYSARILRNVKIQPSPKWLQDLLTSVGVRPINNVVDVTNYVLMETGHPLHAFDYDKLSGHTIVVKRAQEGTRFTTLDGKARTLNGETLMICDAERPVAVAGVMGGGNSEISDATTNVLIESAYFDPRSIRKTSKLLGLSTEASYRFERGADIGITAYAVDRAAGMIQELTGAEVLKGVLDAYPRRRKPASVRLRVSRTNQILGTSLSQNEIKGLLSRLEFRSAAVGRDSLTVRIPTFRVDCSQEIDLIEEVARVHGYNDIETKTLSSIDFSRAVFSDRAETDIRNYCSNAGFNEMVANSLQDEATAALAGLPTVKMLNPVSIDMSTMRASLIPGALQIVRHNRNHGNKHLRLFELGKVYSVGEAGSADPLEQFHEEDRLLIVMSGKPVTAGTGVTPRETDILDLKGEVEALLSKVCLDKYRFIYYDTRSALTDSTISIEINGVEAGFLGRVKGELARKFDIDEHVFVCELTLEGISKGMEGERKYVQLPKFPSVTRDLAFVVDVAVTQLSLEQAIRESGKPLLASVILFDEYSDEKLGAGKKSLAYALEFQSPDHTLNDREIDQVIGRVVEAARTKCGAVLRG